MLKPYLNKWSHLLFFIIFFFISKTYGSTLLGTIPFVTTWKTDNPGFSNTNQIIIPTIGSGYNYTVNWGDGTSPTTHTGDAIHTYAASGIYTVSITGDFPSIFFNNELDKAKLLTIEQWGDNQWFSMEGAFSGCVNLQGNFTDNPDLSNVASLARMFAGALLFNSYIGDWDVSNVTNMSGMFDGAISFNQDIGNWNLSSTTNTSSMFLDATSFNQGIGNWDVSSVISMSGMFRRAELFNQDIGGWDVGSVTSMFGMFNEAISFNQDIGGWNVSSVTIMQDMFRGATLFNQDIGNWNVGNVVNMRHLFSESAFNQDIGNWNVSKVTDMRSMFQNNINFNQDIGSWVLDDLTSANNMFVGATLSPLNYDALLKGWDAQNLNPSISFHAGYSKYCTGASARANMISNDSWSIADGGIAVPSVDDLSNQNVFRSITLPSITGVDLVGNEAYYTGANGTGIAFNVGDVISFFDFPSYPITLYIYGGTLAGCDSQQDFQLTITNTIVPFITTWKTDNPGVSADNQITIPIFSGGGNYAVDWGDGTPATIETDQATHTYTTPGIYTVTITGESQSIVFNDTGDKDKILTIEQWGNTQWFSMFAAFQGCSNLQGNYTDSPNLSVATSTAFMFADATSFNYNVSNWDVSNIVEMQAMFADANVFDQDVSNWDVSKVEDMSFMFKGASVFNQVIGDWDVSNVTNMGAMFASASLFNQDIGNWDVSNVDNMEFMFFEATSFNQDIGNWNVGNVEVMEAMFAEAIAFNQDIGAWNTRKVNDLGAMFYQATSFNQDIGDWDVSKVTRMEIMFFGATSFNQDIGRWSVISVTSMISMFEMATSFDQDLGYWNVTNAADMSKMFDGVRLSVANYDSLLIGWNSKVLQNSVPFSGGLSQYCLGEAARVNMIANDNWVITDAGSVSPVIDDVNDVIVPASYIFPTITGVNLTGNERYFTGANGTGTVYNAGDIVSFNDFSSYPITMYVYDNFNSSCNSEQNFELTITFEPSLLLCTELSLPISGTTNVSVDTDLSWNSVTGATGYRLLVGTNPGENDVFNLDVGNVTSYDLPIDLPGNTVVYVNIVPYNLDGDASLCPEESFTTDNPILVPECTVLLLPLEGDSQVAVNTGLSWEPVPNATGYILTLETFIGAGDVLNRLDVGNTTSYLVSGKLPENTRIFVRIEPYNSAGEAVGCSEVVFITGLDRSSFPFRFFTPNNDGVNDYWMVPNKGGQVLSVRIYDRYGKLLKQMGDLSIGWDGRFNNKLMPADDYWYLITFQDGKTLKGHFSLVR